MYKLLLFVLLGSSLVLSQIQDPNTFCQGVPAGSYCSNSLSGYYWCVSGGTNSFQTCGSGTECSCFVGPNCANVPTVGSFSPCNRHQTTPSYPSAYWSYQTANIVSTNPSCSMSGTSTITVILSASGKERIDTNRNMPLSCGSSSTQTQISEWFFVNADSTLTHYFYQVSSSQCTKEIINGQLPNTRVADGYELLSFNTYSGAYFPSQTANVWYYISGETYPSQPYGYWDEIHASTSGPTIPLYHNRRDDNFRVSTWTNATTITFTQGEPDSQYFTMPSACNSL